MKETKSAAYHTKIAKKYDAKYDVAKHRQWDIYKKVEWTKINKYLPKKKSKILDAGGGTGDFSIAFAKKGHNVLLTDISSGMLKVAEEKINKLKLNNKIAILPQDITNMKDIPSNAFDFVVSLGDPVSYCLNENAAIKELSRVAKKGAYVMITIDCFFIQIPKLIRKHNYFELNKLEKTGTTTSPFNYPQHNFKVDELKRIFEKNKLKVIDVFGLLNFVNKFSNREIDKILSNKSAFKRLMELELKYCNEPSIIGLASHLGIVGKKI